MVKQTAGRDALTGFADDFARYNDDVLFGEVWNNPNISLHNRSMITISCLVGKGIVDDSLKYHITTAKKNGVTKEEMASMLTQLGFYAGWPNAWAALKMAREVYKDGGSHGGMFGLGSFNDAYKQYFIGNSYLNPLTKPTDNVHITNVTFEPGCRNNWHIHHATKGGGQLLICISGSGWYQEEGREPQSLNEGDVVVIRANVKHWHGAKKNCWFSHLAMEIPGENTSNEWCEPVLDEYYNKL